MKILVLVKTYKFDIFLNFTYTILPIFLINYSYFSLVFFSNNYIIYSKYIDIVINICQICKLNIFSLFYYKKLYRNIYKLFYFSLYYSL